MAVPVIKVKPIGRFLYSRIPLNVMDGETKLVTKFIGGLITLIEKKLEMFDIHTC